MEKRGLDSSVEGNVCIVVRFSYDLSANSVIETAWSPDSNENPKSIVRKLGKTKTNGVEE
jgi:hypothetical protein